MEEYTTVRQLWIWHDAKDELSKVCRNTERGFYNKYQYVSSWQWSTALFALGHVKPSFRGAGPAYPHKNIIKHISYFYRIYVMALKYEYLEPVLKQKQKNQKNKKASPPSFFLQTPGR